MSLQKRNHKKAFEELVTKVYELSFANYFCLFVLSKEISGIISNFNVNFRIIEVNISKRFHQIPKPI